MVTDPMLIAGFIHALNQKLLGPRNEVALRATLSKILEKYLEDGRGSEIIILLRDCIERKC